MYPFYLIQGVHSFILLRKKRNFISLIKNLDLLPFFLDKLFILSIREFVFYFSQTLSDKHTVFTHYFFPFRILSLPLSDGIIISPLPRWRSHGRTRRDDYGRGHFAGIDHFWYCFTSKIQDVRPYVVYSFENKFFYMIKFTHDSQTLWTWCWVIGVEGRLTQP